MMDDRAVSEVIAFILVFALILMSVGVLYTTGLQSMTGFKDSEQQRNAERAIGSLGANFNDVLRNDRVEQRAGELALREGRLSVVNQSTPPPTVQINMSAPGWDNATIGMVEDVGALVYETGTTRIAYQSGGTFRKDGDSDSVLLERPRMVCNTDAMGGEGAAVISVMRINSPSRSVQSDGNLQVTILEEETESFVTHDASGNVNVTVDDNSPFSEGWEMALDRGDWESGECDADHVTVRIVTVDVELSTDTN